jgi:hypothetical protein
VFATGSNLYFFIKLKLWTMKKIYFLLVTLLVVVAGWSQTTTTWVGGVNSNWDNAGNWDNGVPAANYIVIFPTGVNQTITRVAQGGNITLLGLSIQGNSEIRLVSSAGRNITIANGVAADDFIVDAGARLTLGTNLNIILGMGAAGNPTHAAINGEFIIEAFRA